MIAACLASSLLSTLSGAQGRDASPVNPIDKRPAAPMAASVEPEPEKAAVAEAEPQTVAAESETAKETVVEAEIPAAAAPVEVVTPAETDGTNVVEIAGKAKKSDAPKSVRITSKRADADRKQGVILFDGNVFVDDSEYQLHSDRLYVFLEGTNNLKRIVAIGNVAITNDQKRGYCAKATYSKERAKVVMYGDGPVMARLVDGSKKKSEVEGSKITFWINADQVEVENSTVTLEGGGAGMKEQAKKLKNGK